MATNTFGQDVTTAGGSIVPTPPTPSPISVSGLATPQQPVNIPTAPPVDTHIATNASVPTPQSIIDQNNAPTATDTQQSQILERIAQMTGDEKSLATQQINQEASAGVGALADTRNALADQIQGLADQSTQLQLDASQNGKIQNQQRLAEAGGNIEAAQSGRPLTREALLANQIQQSAISSQQLTLKAAFLASDRKYSSAKDAADKAAQVAFDADEQQIKHQAALLAAIQPQLSKEQQGRAALLQTQLQDRQTQISNARDDFKAGQQLAISAMSLNPDDPQAQFAAQQALKLDPKDPNYLTNVANLVAKYQQDPTKTQQALATLQYTRAQTAKLNADIQSMAPGSSSVTNPQASQYKPALDVILGSEKFTAQQKASVIQGVNNGDDPVSVIKNQAKNIMGQTEATTVTKYETAQSSLKDIQNTLTDFYAAGGKTDIFSGNYEKVINKLGNVNDPKLVDLATQIQANLQIYRNAVSGTAYSAQEGTDIASIFPGINKSQGLNEAILKGRMTAFDSTIDGAYRSALGSSYDALKTVTTKAASSSTLPPDVQSVVKANTTFSADGKTAYIPRSVWTSLGANMDAILKEAQADGVTLLVQ